MVGIFRTPYFPQRQVRQRWIAGPTPPLVAGVPSFVSTDGTYINMICTASAGGAQPITQQWQRSTTSGSGFGNLSGKTSLTLADNSSLAANTRYYYRVVFTDAIAQQATSSEAFGALPFDPSAGGGTGGVSDLIDGGLLG
jgi:hypothetical protein